MTFGTTDLEMWGRKHTIQNEAETMGLVRELGGTVKDSNLLAMF